jgi:hypothetical protein
MKFLLQSDKVSEVEKRVITHASMVLDFEIISKPLQTLLSDDTLKSTLPIDAAPVGTVEFFAAVLKLHGIDIPEHISYPKCLHKKEFLQRKIRTGIFSDAMDHEFVKPRYDIKKFTGDLVKNLPLDLFIEHAYPVYISDPVEFVSEWRYYIVNNKIMGAGRYDDGADEAPKPDINLIQKALDLMRTHSLAGYALDFGVLSTGETALIEANDGWALGFYKGEIEGMRCSFEGPCGPRHYAQLLHARWIQIINQN